MAAPVLQFKRGLFTNLPGLRAGEPGFTTDRYDLYVGIDSTTDNNQLVGSSRFWHIGAGTTGWGVNLVEGTDNGTDYISLRSPAALAGIVTYYFPGTQGVQSTVLTNDGNGNLSWASGSANPVFTGVATFTDTTDNTLGDSNTGAVQIDGGLGVDKNVTVGGNLNVQGYSEFVGVVTFKGGTINLGDANTDDINVAGEFISSLVPNDDNSYDVGGDATKQWRHANFAGIGTFDGGLDIGGEATFASATVEDLTDNRVVLAGTGGALEDSANLTFDGTTLTVATTVDATNVEVSNIKAKDGTQAIAIADATAHVSIAQSLTVNGDLLVLGSTTEVNTETLKVEDSLIEVGLVNSGGTLVPPVSDLNIDVGVLFHYHTGAAAKKAGLFWDDSVSRVVVGSDLTESSSVMTIATYASFEIGSLWVNDAAGQSEVIRHDGTQRVLENITVDGGAF